MTDFRSCTALLGSVLALALGAGNGCADTQDPSLSAIVGVRLPDGTECRGEQSCSYRLADTSIGGTTAFALVFFNDGDASAELFNLELSGAPSFKIASEAPEALAPHGEQRVRFEWAPAIAGVESSELSLHWRPPESLTLVELFGRAAVGF